MWHASSGRCGSSSGRWVSSSGNLKRLHSRGDLSMEQLHHHLTIRSDPQTTPEIRPEAMEHVSGQLDSCHLWLANILNPHHLNHLIYPWYGRYSWVRAKPINQTWKWNGCGLLERTLMYLSQDLLDKITIVLNHNSRHHYCMVKSQMIIYHSGAYARSYYNLLKFCHEFQWDFVYWDWDGYPLSIDSILYYVPCYPI